MLQSILRTGGLLGTFSVAVLLTHTAAAGESPIGKSAPEFRLSDAAGQEHSLAGLDKARLVVVVFVGTECPLAKLYAPRLGQLAKEYAERGVTFLGIDSNQQDTAEEVAAYVREHDLPFPVVKDPDNQVADQFAAARTPEAFLLDAKRMIRYRGRIDDQYGVGVQKTQLGRRDLASAIDELLADRAVSVPERPSAGCFIGRVTKPAAGEVTYSRQIARIFDKNCVDCHRKGEIGPFALTSYDEAVGWGETIREVVIAGACPPGSPILSTARSSTTRGFRTTTNGRSRGGSTPAVRRAIPRTCPSRESSSTAGIFPRPTLFSR